MIASCISFSIFTPYYILYILATPKSGNFRPSNNNSPILSDAILKESAFNIAIYGSYTYP
nr:MAG TPA: hypothetical protein [Siphoviridae sp. ctgbm9]